MRARMICDCLVVYPRYGGRQIFGSMSTLCGRLRFYKWYIRYMWIWRDHLDIEGMRAEIKRRWPDS